MIFDEISIKITQLTLIPILNIEILQKNVTKFYFTPILQKLPNKYHSTINQNTFQVIKMILQNSLCRHMIQYNTSAQTDDENESEACIYNRSSAQKCYIQCSIFSKPLKTINSPILNKD